MLAELQQTQHELDLSEASDFATPRNMNISRSWKRMGYESV